MPAPATPNRKYVSGDFSVATACSLPVFDAPFKDDGILTQYQLTQDFMQTLASFTAGTLDEAHPDYSDYKLASESELRDRGGGIVQWTRTYLKLPTEYTKPRGTYSFTFPGFSGLVYGGVVGFGGSSDGRLPLSDTVPMLVTRTFYNTTDPEADIPIEQKFEVYYGGGNNVVQYLNNNADNPLYADTTPSRTAYDAAIAAEDYLIVEDSTWKPWLGNFYIRETMRVKYK